MGSSSAANDVADHDDPWRDEQRKKQMKPYYTRVGQNYHRPTEEVR